LDGFSVIFSLNWFFDKKIKADFYFAFLEELAKMYTREIKQLPRKSGLSDLVVQSVMPARV
jgi:hypothetical protein